MNQLRPLLPLQFDQPAPLPGLPPLISLPPLQQRQAMLAANGLPMLQPGTAPVGDLQGQFPDANVSGPGPMALPTDPGPDEGSSGYREFAGGEIAAPGGGAGSPGGLPGAAPGWQDRLRNVLALSGVAMIGLGGPQGQNPLLAQLVLKQAADRQNQEGFRNAIGALQTAQETSGGDRRAYLSNLAGLIRGGGFDRSPTALGLLQKEYSAQNDAAIKSGELGRQATAASQLRVKLRETGDFNRVVSENAELVALAGGPEFTKSLWEEVKPTRTTVNNRIVETPTVGPRAGQAAVIYEGQGQTHTVNGIVYREQPDGSLKPLGGNVTSRPGERQIGIDANLQPIGTIASTPEAPTPEAKLGLEFLRLDPATATPAQLGVASATGTLAKRLRPETIETMIANGDIDSVIPGFSQAMRQTDMPGTMGRALKAEEASKIAVTGATGQAAEALRQRTARDNPAILQPHLASPEAEVYDRTSGRFVSKFQAGIVGAAERNPEQYKVVQGDDLRGLRGLRSIDRFIPMFEEVAKGLTTQPGVNVYQALTETAKARFGVDSLGTVTNTLKASQLVLAKAFQGSAQNLSDADRKTVEGLVPTTSDTAQQVLQKVNFLKTYTRLIKSSILDDDDMSSAAVVDFVRNLPWAAQSGTGGAPPPIPGMVPRAK